ncbi:carbohydrate ABC transporter permease [Natronobacterium texcoconense]|uniref:Carbohydrate ABC transporter membrane protein 2, CUT1 family n=1 Tax=Natronobacterium texcoconense TaxID=1095778 RepID=A0A1H1FRG3_NATTX|nr:carbohydrate ABC transporter permease [Natronobacterium texcoconense]SDR03514.1 carbohydrate ABC transporter membrane protein 2, CUT1 family [Natronobacterium texcoconense]
MSTTNSKESLPVRFAVYISLLVVVVITFVPLYWMIVAASLPQEEFFTLPPRLLPGTHFIENVQALEARFPYLRSVWNSVFVATVYTVISLFLCALAGFAFAKYEFKYREPLFYFILATLVLPVQIMIIPMYLLMAQFGLLDTHIALILPFLANPIGIFLMRQSMLSIPDSWLDAARIDGASEFQIFYRVVLPAMKPMLAALAIILFITQWNMFLYPLVILESEELFTIPLAIERLTGHHRIYFDQIMAAATIAIVPMIVLFLWLQEHFVRGFTNSM